MKIIFSKRQLLIFISFAIITFSNARFFIKTGLDDPIAYFGYFLLLCGIALSYLELSKLYRTYINRNLIIALISFSVGIFIQPMGLGIKIRLFLTMFIIAVTALASDGLMESFDDMRIGAYGLLTGELMVFLLSLVTQTKVFSNVEEGFGNIFISGFDAGMSHKNYFSMILFASMSVIFMYRKYCKKKLFDFIVLLIIVFLILISQARVTMVLSALFFAILSLDKIKFYVKQRHLVKIIGIPLLFVVAASLTRQIYVLFIRYSRTYLSRVSGLTSYWFIYCAGDTFHRVFGNAATFFGSSESYYENFRKIINYGGAVDMALLNILIKNGLIGLVGYVLIFGRLIKQAMQTKSVVQRECCLAIVIPMIASMLSENCVSTISLSYAPFCYVVLASLYKQMQQCKNVISEKAIFVKGMESKI